MNRQEAKELLPIIQAFSEGKEIEGIYKGIKSPWFKVEDMVFDGGTIFRIKPEPKYRPFKNIEECWKEMQKHQPFGWIINIDTERSRMIEIVDKSEDTNLPISICGRWWTLAQLFEKFIFDDGTLFGIKE